METLKGWDLMHVPNVESMINAFNYTYDGVVEFGKHIVKYGEAFPSPPYPQTLGFLLDY